MGHWYPLAFLGGWMKRVILALLGAVFGSGCSTVTEANVTLLGAEDTAAVEAAHISDVFYRLEQAIRHIQTGEPYAASIGANENLFVSDILQNCVLESTVDLTARLEEVYYTSAVSCPLHVIYFGSGTVADGTTTANGTLEVNINNSQLSFVLGIERMTCEVTSEYRYLNPGESRGPRPANRLSTSQCTARLKSGEVQFSARRQYRASYEDQVSARDLYSVTYVHSGHTTEIEHEMDILDGALLTQQIRLNGGPTFLLPKYFVPTLVRSDDIVKLNGVVYRLAQP